MKAGLLNSTIGRAAAAAVAIALAACAIGGAVALNPSSQKKLAQKEPADLLELPKAEDIAPPIAAPEPVSEPEPETVDDDVEFAEATNRSEAEEQSKQRRCWQNFFPVNVIQKLNDDAFLAYTRFSVGYPEPVLLTYKSDKRPASSGFVVLSPRDGLLLGGTQTIEMENGFSRKASLLTIGDKRCARLWAVIASDLGAARDSSKSTQDSPSRKPVSREEANALREVNNPPSEVGAEEAAGLADVSQ